MKRKTVALVVVIVMLLAAVVPATAITGGEPDNGRHPYVGLAVFYNAGGEPLWRCSGTLLSEKLFLTAGHCTAPDGPKVPASARVWFDENVTAATGYPFSGGVTGTPYTHPSFNFGAFPATYDVGVIVLDTSVTDKGYGALPPANYLSDLDTRRGQNDLTFMVVGYGLQEIKPTLMEERSRLKATSTLVNLRSALTDGYNIHTSNNPGQGQGRGQTSGGTCFGDSGGPVFYPANSNQVVGITSFGLNQNCKGADFAFRTDVPGVADWIMAH